MTDIDHLNGWGANIVTHGDFTSIQSSKTMQSDGNKKNQQLFWFCSNQEEAVSVFVSSKRQWLSLVPSRRMKLYVGAPHSGLLLLSSRNTIIFH